MLTKSSKQLLDLCEDMIDFSYIEQGAEKPIAARIFDMRSLANNILDLNKPAAFKKNRNY